MRKCAEPFLKWVHLTTRRGALQPPRTGGPDFLHGPKGASAGLLSQRIHHGSESSHGSPQPARFGRIRPRTMSVCL
jgi:hypothetical protein